MSTTVSVGGFEVTTNNPDTAAVVESLQPREEESPEPRVLVDKGQPVEQKEGLSKAASEMGKEGGKAAAKARAKAGKEKPAAKEAAPAEAPAKAEPADDADEAEAEGKEAKAGDPRKDPKARIAELAREKNELRQRAERAERDASRVRELEDRLRAVESGKAQPAHQPAAQPADDDPEPEEGDFEFHKDYVKALARHEYRQAGREAEREFSKHRQAIEREHTWQQARGRFAEAVKAEAKTDPEFLTTLSPDVAGLMPSREALDRGARPEQLTVENWIADDIMAAPERAARLMRHLSQDSDALQRLRTLSSPRAVTRELAKIEAGLDVNSDAVTGGASADTQEPEISKATPPVRPLTGAPSVAQGNVAPRPGESFDEWHSRTQPKR